VLLNYCLGAPLYLVLLNYCLGAPLHLVLLNYCLGAPLHLVLLNYCLGAPLYLVLLNYCLGHHISNSKSSYIWCLPISTLNQAEYISQIILVLMSLSGRGCSVFVIQLQLSSYSAHREPTS
jgi:hypothetical protein